MLFAMYTIILLSYIYLFQLVSSSQKVMIINAYKMELKNNSKITIRECRIVLSKRLGIGQRTISNTISEYNTSKSVMSPNRRRCKKSFKDDFDDLHRNTMRRHVHSSVADWPRVESGRSPPGPLS